MATPEERLETVETDLKQFKTDTVKAYANMAHEFAMIKGLQDDSLRRLTTISRQVENIDNRISIIDNQLEIMRRQNSQRFDAIDQRFNTIESTLAQILARLPNPTLSS